MSSLSSAFASANRGPITTIFTPPASCLSTTTIVSFPTTALANTTSTFITTKIFINHFSWGDSACYPQTIATRTGDGYTIWANGYYYSPGVCPSGWSTACQISTSALGFATSIKSQTTAMICCPTNYDCVGGTTTFANRGCSTALAAGQILTEVWLAPQPTTSVALDISSGDRDITTFSIPRATSAVCDGIPVLWQNTDVEVLALLGITATTSLTSSGSGSQTSSAIASETSSSQTQTPSSNSSSLSSGAKIGIGISIPVAVILLLTALLFFFRRRAARMKSAQTPHEDQATSPGGWTPLASLQHQHDVKIAEAPGERDPAELGAVDRAGELDGVPFFEMEDTSRPGSERSIRRKKVGTGLERTALGGGGKGPAELEGASSERATGANFDIEPPSAKEPASYTI